MNTKKNRTQAPIKNPVEITCPRCKTTILKVHHHQKFCSKNCYTEYYYERKWGEIIAASRQTVTIDMPGAVIIVRSERKTGYAGNKIFWKYDSTIHLLDGRVLHDYCEEQGNRMTEEQLKDYFKPMLFNIIDLPSHQDHVREMFSNWSGRKDV